MRKNTPSEFGPSPLQRLPLARLPVWRAFVDDDQQCLTAPRSHHRKGFQLGQYWLQLGLHSALGLYLVAVEADNLPEGLQGALPVASEWPTGDRWALVGLSAAHNVPDRVLQLPTSPCQVLGKGRICLQRSPTIEHGALLNLSHAAACRRIYRQLTALHSDRKVAA